MKISIIVKADNRDAFTLLEDEENKSVFINSVASEEQSNSAVNHDIPFIFKSNHLTFTEVGLDFLNLGVAAYAIDQLVSRESFGYIKWNRYLSVHLPVYNLTKWKIVKVELENAFSFLSGDKWEFHFRKRKKNDVKKNPNEKSLDIQGVSLFSGGLDSFIGVVDLLEKLKIAVVGHHKKGGNEQSTQSFLLSELKKHYGEKQIKGFQFFVQPEKKRNKILGGEDTQRARSILYIALGIAVANSIGTNVPLYIPENGLISLNIPLTSNRQGTYSTKTTHPSFLGKLEKILHKLSINNELINPYQFQTKGEMIINTKNPKLVKSLADITISCSKPNNYRRWHKSDHIQCGYCVPCIIRRAALYRAKLDDPKNYEYDVRGFGNNYNGSIGADYHAFQIALYRYITKKKLGIFDVLKSGSVPAEMILEFLSVSKRGLTEVNDFIHKK
jgi:hypothetical protein